MANSTLTLDLEAFQGPFDLLLHLIKEQDIDINDIPMAEITEQYLVYIQQMQELELDTIGDYLVMAATLLEIKSKLLLPIEPDETLPDDYEAEDPRASLIQQLLLYQQFQNVSTQLEILSSERQKSYTRTSENLSHYTKFIPLAMEEITMEQLTSALEEVLKKYNMRHPALREIQQDQVSVSDQMDYMLSRLNQQEALTFTSLIQKGSRSEIIATFLAMLELVRKHAITFSQTERVGSIYLKKAR